MTLLGNSVALTLEMLYLSLVRATQSSMSLSVSDGILRRQYVDDCRYLTLHLMYLLWNDILSVGSKGMYNSHSHI